MAAGDIFQMALLIVVATVVVWYWRRRGVPWVGLIFFVAAPVVMTGIGLIVIWRIATEIGLDFFPLPILQVLSFPLAALVGVAALYGARVATSDPRQRRRFVISGAVLVTSFTLTVLFLSPQIETVERWEQPSGGVLVLTSAGVERAVLVFSLESHGLSGYVRPAPGNEPVDPWLRSSGHPNLTLTIVGAPGSTVEFAYILTGALAMPYKSLDGSSASTTDSDLSTELWTDSTSGTCVDARPRPETAVVVLHGSTIGVMVRGALELDQMGVGSSTIKGVDETVWAVKVGDYAYGYFPKLTAQTATASLSCVVGTGILEGEWPLPPSTTLVVIDSVAETFGASQDFQYRPESKYNATAGFWESTLSTEETEGELSPPGEWPGKNSIEPQWSVLDPSASVGNSLAVFLSATFGAVVVGVLIDLVYHWPRRSPGIIHAPLAGPTEAPNVADASRKRSLAMPRPRLRRTRQLRATTSQPQSTVAKVRRWLGRIR